MYRFKKWMAKHLIEIAYKVQDEAQKLRNLATRLDPPEPELPKTERKVRITVTSRAGVPFYGCPN